MEIIEKGEKHVKYGVILVSLLLTLNIFYNFF